MATKSILRNVDMNSKKSAKSLVIALETAKDEQSQLVTLSRTYKDVEGNALQKMINKFIRK